MKTLILTLVILAQLGAPAYAQSGQPEAKAPNPASTDSLGSGDTDKKRVQDRWGTSTGTSSTSKKTAKPGTPGKPQPQNPSNTNP